jgi:hypothetical protein
MENKAAPAARKRPGAIDTGDDPVTTQQLSRTFQPAPVLTIGIPAIRSHKPNNPLLSSASRSCCECGDRFIPSDLPRNAYGRERGAFGVIYTCPDCVDSEGWE